MSLLRDLKGYFFRWEDEASLPDHVKIAIRKQEWQNELLLRLIQFLIIVLFCVIYIVSPKTFPADAITPVPYVLSAYLVFSIIGLILAFRSEPKDWHGYVSIFSDFALLYGLMVSFHIQYMQPASFILKAPALLYVFIFISIRALRFHPKFVLLAGIVAILGWAAVIMYVTESDPSENPLTRSYVDYLTSNAILIGAEVDKVLSISFVTIILAAAVNGSKNLLIDSVTEKATNRQLSRFFDKTVAEGIRSKASDIVPGKGEERVATILTIDIRGFSRLVSDVDANRVMELLFAYQSRVLPIIRKHGGTIDKFMGDGIMVIFGVDDSVNKPALRALNAASDLLLDYPNWNQQDEVMKQIGPIRIGIGIASGTIAWGAVGFEDRLEMTAIGSPVNRAAKLEKQNSVLGSECICDLFTWEAALSEGYKGALSAKRTTGKVDGLSEETDYMILLHDGASRKDQRISMDLDQPVNLPKV